MLAHAGPVAYGIAAESMAQKDVKVCLLGRHHVGKTSIVQRFVKGTFSEKYSSTIGAAFSSRSFVFRDIEYRFKLWDTAGQERFRSLAPLTYRGASAALLVYDITDNESLEDVSFWMGELRKHGPEDILIYIVGNKMDLESRRTVDREVAERYAESHGAFHHHSSAKTGAGVDEIFFHICQMMLTVWSAKNESHHRRQSLIGLGDTINNDDENNHQKKRGCHCRDR